MLGIKKTYYTNDKGEIIKQNTNQLISNHYSKAQKILKIDIKNIENQYKKIIGKYCQF